MEQIEPRSASQPLSVRRPPGSSSEGADILGAGALTFIGVLASRLEAERQRLIAQRPMRRVATPAKEGLGFSPESRFVRESAWRVAAFPPHLSDRVVKVVHAAEREALADAAATPGQLVVASFDGAASFDDMVAGHRNLRQALRAAPADQDAVLACCPRGIALADAHFRLAAEPIGAALVDFALYLFHGAHALLRRGNVPFVCLSGLEHYLEARWWCQVIDAAEHTLGLPRGSVKVSVRIEEPPAAFQMHELLYELREHAVGLHYMGWEDVFRCIEALKPALGRVASKREQLSMSQGFVSALLARTCAQRGALLMEERALSRRPESSLPAL